MIFGKIWRAIKAQFNKLGNWVAGKDPIAQMQLEYDQAVEQLKHSREGLAQYRALVERLTRQGEGDRKNVAQLEARIKAYLQAGDRESAARYALELQKAKASLGENEAQLKQHEQGYENHLTKIKHAMSKLEELKGKIQKYDATLKMSRAEAEIAQVASTLNVKVDVTSNFGQMEQIVQDQIDKNRAKSRVATDLSGEGLADIQRERAMEQNMADAALREFEESQKAGK